MKENWTKGQKLGNGDWLPTLEMNRKRVNNKEESQNEIGRTKARIASIKRDGQIIVWCWARDCRVGVGAKSPVNRMVFLPTPSRGKRATDKLLCQAELRYSSVGWIRALYRKRWVEGNKCIFRGIQNKFCEPLWRWAKLDQQRKWIIGRPRMVKRTFGKGVNEIIVQLWRIRGISEEQRSVRTNTFSRARDLSNWRRTYPKTTNTDASKRTPW